MSNIIGAILMVAAPVAVAIFVIGVLAVIGLVAYDLVFPSTGKAARASVEEADLEPLRTSENTQARIYVERGIARAFVILGGMFWGVAAFAGLYSFRQTGMATAIVAASIPLLATLATLAVGWYWERIASVMLAVMSVAAVAWGITSGFELGVWALVTLALIGPMMTASVLFWLARREQEALEIHLALHPELELVAAER